MSKFTPRATIYNGEVGGTAVASVTSVGHDATEGAAT